MPEVDATGWERALEALRRGDVGPYEWVNVVDGADCVREYRLDGVVVMRMRVVGSMGEGMAHELDRVFEVSQEIIDAAAYIYVPTQAEHDLWDAEDEDGEGNALYDKLAEIASREIRDSAVERRPDGVRV